jgi:hypothetical protein
LAVMNPQDAQRDKLKKSIVGRTYVQSLTLTHFCGRMRPSGLLFPEEGKEQAKSSKDVHSRMEAGSSPVGTNQRKTPHPGGSRTGQFRHVDPSVAQEIERAGPRSVPRERASDRSRRGAAPTQTGVGEDATGNEWRVSCANGIMRLVGLLITPQRRTVLRAHTWLRTAWIAALRPDAPRRNGPGRALPLGPMRGGFPWLLCLMCFHGAWEDGPWPPRLTSYWWRALSPSRITAPHRSGRSIPQPCVSGVACGNE